MVRTSEVPSFLEGTCFQILPFHLNKPHFLTFKERRCVCWGGGGSQVLTYLFLLSHPISLLNWNSFGAIAFPERTLLLYQQNSFTIYEKHF